LHVESWAIENSNENFENMKISCRVLDIDNAQIFVQSKGATMSKQKNTKTKKTF